MARQQERHDDRLNHDEIHAFVDEDALRLDEPEDAGAPTPAKEDRAHSQ